ncbi:fibronectin type III domain-containing protein [Cellulomonas sp. HZM]|uniref:fibronectin type III domain-containing protein n=1 Tax=Cellulomonas sp. HZM TaxID=1454010 RepID=UPI000493024D|nr:fibronectin type III domain-containing protein [Cellulomonas sp. HZM]
MKLRRLTAATTALAVGLGLAAISGIPAAAAAEVAQIDVSATHAEIGDDDVQLAWLRVPGATSYTVQVSTSLSSFEGAALVDSTTTRALRWVPTTRSWGATDAQTLYWRVVPQGVGANAVDATVYSFERDSAPVPALVSPEADAVISYPAPVTMSWSTLPGATKYLLQYGVAGQPTRTSVTVTSTSYTPASLAPGDYQWSVQPFFATTSSSTDAPGHATADRSFTVVWPSGVSRPTLLSPANGAFANDLEFRWTPVTGAKEYLVELASSPEFTDDTVVLRSTVSGTVFVPTDVVVNRTYYWRVTAYDVNGLAGEPSGISQVAKRMSMSEASVLDTDESTARPSFTNIGTTVEGATVLPFDQFQLSWTPVPRTTYYQVTVNKNGQAPVTCKTASTSATIVAKSTATGNSTQSLSNSAECLWTTDAAAKIAPGDALDSDAGIYIAKVVAVNMSASKTSTYQSSNPSNSDVQSTTVSVDHYFRVGAATRTSTQDVVVDPVAGSVLGGGYQRTSDASPLLSWAPVTGANGYVVRLYADADKSSQVAELRTTTPMIRSTGVFVANNTNVSTDAYTAEVTPAVVNDTEWLELSTRGKGIIQWQRTATSPAAGVVTYQGNVPLLSMTSTPRTQLGGANRGYEVQVFKSGSSSAYAKLRVDQPSTVAAKSFSFSSSTKTFTATALEQGDYEFAWDVLDAAGNSGPLSARVPFSMGRLTPTDLTQQLSADGTSALLSWSSPVSAASYTVTVRDTSGASFPTIPATTARAVSVQGLVPGKTYTWSVTAKDRSGNVTYASPTSTLSVSQSTVTLRPAALTDVSSSAPTIAWDPVPGASRYLVRVAEASKGLATATAVETSALSHVPTGALAYGTAYLFDVRAVPEVRTTSSTRPVLAASATGTLSVRTPPGIPSLATPTVSGTGLTATWTALTGAAAGTTTAPTYVVRFRPQTAPEQAWASRDVTGTSLTLTGLNVGTTYEVAVAAKNSEGQGGWSTTRTVTTAGPPNAPSSVRATSGLKQLAVSWGSASSKLPVTAYTIRWRPTSATTWTTRSLSATTRSYTITGLGQATYRVEVTATSAAGTGLPATVDQVSYGQASAPRSVAAKRGDGKASVTWSAPSSAGGSTLQGYRVERRQYSSSSKKWSAWTQATTTSSSTRSATLSGLTNGTAYQVRVTARTSAGDGVASGAVSVTPAGKPKAPTSVKVTVSKGKAKVSWKKPSSNGSVITGYTVQYSTNGTSWKTAKSASKSATSATWTKAKKGKRYYVRVVAKNAVGTGTASSKVSFTAK